METGAPSNLNDEIASLQREIARLDAMQQKPYVTSMSSSVSPQGEPEGWPKTSQQIEFENKLAELLRKRNQGTGAIEAEDRAAFEGRVGKEEDFKEKQIAPEQTDTALEATVAPSDPLAPARDRGARLDDLLAFTWPGTQDSYVVAAADRSNANRGGADPAATTRIRRAPARAARTRLAEQH